MRVSSLEEMKGAGGTQASKRPPQRTLFVGGLVLAAVAFAGAYALWFRNAPEAVNGEPEKRPLRSGEVLGFLAKEGVSDATLPTFFDASGATSDFASDHAKGDSSASKTKSLVAAIRARASKQAFVPWSPSTPREPAVRAPSAVFPLLAKDGGRAHLFPLEVALAAVVALRAEDVPAMLAEVIRFEAETAPPDPSGKFGYYGVAVPTKPGGDEYDIFDPYAGREPKSVAESRVLTDIQALGAVLNHRAVHAYAVEGKTSEALALSEKAVALDPLSPNARGVHASVLSFSGGGPEALREFEAASSIRLDPPRQLFLAQIALARQDLDGANKHIAEALRDHPDFGEAHALLAQIRLAGRDSSGAKSEIEAAEAADSDLPSLPLLWADYHMLQGDMELAAKFADKALATARHNWQVRLKAAWVLRAAGRYDEMRVEAKRVLDAVPAAQRDVMKQTIEQLLGPTALEDSGPSEVAAPSGAESPEGVAALPEANGEEFKLGQGSSLLGGDTGGGLRLQGGGSGSGATGGLGDDFQLKLEP
ncbi:MAG: hypothetical protein KC417_00685 [Myxococcales bacterium]|nr:hypothetical protein [Myxococcales bacterium]